MRFAKLNDWLGWQETLNPKEIELGLDRVEKVLSRLALNSQFNCPVITLAGTNGKGSTAAFLQAILLASNYRVGCYTSPHLDKYNERIQINAMPVSDERLCTVFEEIDQARGNIPLTYFEFGTLAALLIFFQSKLDVLVLEIGLGGRLDAVNVIDPDVAVITSVGLDHMDWLGHDVESIGREKAGIFRAKKPAVYGALNLPESVKRLAQEKSVDLHAAGRDYLYQGMQNSWQFSAAHVRYSDLPMPALQGAIQMQNAAAAIMALQCIKHLLPVAEKAIKQGLRKASILGRFQQLALRPEVIVDVAHNPQAAQALSDMLSEKVIKGRTLMVIAMLQDKAVNDVVERLKAQVDVWFCAGLDVARGLSSELLVKAVAEQIADDKLSRHQNVAEACEAALNTASENDRIIVMGSFYTVKEAQDYFAI